MNIYEKWEPIIDTLLKYSENKDSQKLRKFLAEYAEHHSEKENDFIISENMNSTLPISLKLLSMLNIDDVKLNIIDDEIPKMKIVNNGVGLELETDYDNKYENLEINVSITKEELFELRHYIGIDIVQKVEHLLLEENAKVINKQLETKKELDIYLMVNNINMSAFVNHGNGIKEQLKNPIISISNMIKLN